METLSNFKSAIESLECPEHHRHPAIEVDNDALLRLKCCCPDFKVRCFYIFKKMLDGHSIDNAVGIWDMMHDRRP